MEADWTRPPAQSTAAGRIPSGASAFSQRKVVNGRASSGSRSSARAIGPIEAAAVAARSRCRPVDGGVRWAMSGQSPRGAHRRAVRSMKSRSDISINVNQQSNLHSRSDVGDPVLCFGVRARAGNGGGRSVRSAQRSGQATLNRRWPSNRPIGPTSTDPSSSEAIGTRVTIHGGPDAPVDRDPPRSVAGGHACLVAVVDVTSG